MILLTDKVDKILELVLLALVACVFFWLARRILNTRDIKLFSRRPGQIKRTDYPLANFKSDFLDRKQAVSEILSQIHNAKHNTLTICLEGSWGTGKTSVINFVEEKIDPKKWDILKFNPWNLNNWEQVVEEIFHSLKTKYGYLEYKSLAYRLKEQGISDSGIPKLDGFLENDLSFQEKLDDFKHHIQKRLEETDKKLLVVFDDLDRIFDKEIIANIFKVIGLYLEIPRVYTVASVDESALRKIFREDYPVIAGYTERVFDYKVKLARHNLAHFFKNEILSSEEINNLSKLDQIQLNALCREAELLGIFTIRQAKRLIHAIKKKIYLLEDLDLNDLILMEHMKVAHPIVWEDISLNRHYFITAEDKNAEYMKLFALVNSSSLIDEPDDFLLPLFKKWQEIDYKHDEKGFLNVLSIINLVFASSKSDVEKILEKHYRNKYHPKRISYSVRCFGKKENHFDNHYFDEYDIAKEKTKRIARRQNLDLYFGLDKFSRDVASDDHYPYYEELERAINKKNLADFVFTKYIEKYESRAVNEPEENKKWGEEGMWLDILIKERLIALAYKDRDYQGVVLSALEDLKGRSVHKRTKENMIKVWEDAKKFSSDFLDALEDRDSHPDKYKLSIQGSFRW